MKLISIASGDRDGLKESVIDMLGEAFWTALTENFGGISVDVPKRTTTLHPEHPIVQALGLDNACALVSIFGGECISVPKASAPTNLQLCLDGVGHGLNNREIARKLGLTERGVRLILRRARLKNPNCVGNPELSAADAKKFGLPVKVETDCAPVGGISRVSNGGLTGIAAISANQIARNTETSASGL